MADEIVISIDGACSGKRAACAAVASRQGRVVAEKSRTVWDTQGYALAAEIAGVALAAELARRIAGRFEPVTLEVDNPSTLAVLRGSYRPPRFERIPPAVLAAAVDFCEGRPVRMRVLRRNSTPGLSRADRLARQRLWAGRRVK